MLLLPVYHPCIFSCLSNFFNPFTTIPCKASPIISQFLLFPALCSHPFSLLTSFTLSCSFAVLNFHSTFPAPSYSLTLTNYLHSCSQFSTPTQCYSSDILQCWQLRHLQGLHPRVILVVSQAFALTLTCSFPIIQFTEMNSFIGYLPLSFASIPQSPFSLTLCPF